MNRLDSALSYVLVPIVIIIVVGAPVWICVKSRPLGSLPYRWGAFMGIQSFIIVLIFLAFLLSDLEKEPGSAEWILGTLPLLAVLAGVGIFRRERWGVVLLFVLQMLLLVGVVAVPAEKNESPARAIGPLAALGINAWYFGRRWRLMGRNSSNANNEAPEPEADVQHDVEAD